MGQAVSVHHNTKNTLGGELICILIGSVAVTSNS